MTSFYCFQSAHVIQNLRKDCKTAKMASTCVRAVEECLCVYCLVLTKYRCLSCETAICSKCSHFEHNEETEGWMAGKAVSYCGFCYEELQQGESYDHEADEPNTNMMAKSMTDKESSSPRSPSPPPKIDIYILIPNDSAHPGLYTGSNVSSKPCPCKMEVFPGPLLGLLKIYMVQGRLYMVSLEGKVQSILWNF